MFDANNLKDAGDNLHSLLSSFSEGSVTLQKYDDPIDEEVVNFYKQRFLMFRDDGVLNCINDYIEHSQKAEINDATKMRISIIALNVIAGGNGDV